MADGGAQRAEANAGANASTQRVLSEDLVVKSRRWLGWGRPLAGIVLASAEDGSPELFGESSDQGPPLGKAEVSLHRHDAAHERAAFASPKLERTNALEVLDRVFQPGDCVTLRQSSEFALVERVDSRIDVQLLNSFTLSSLDPRLLQPPRLPCPGSLVLAYGWLGRVTAVSDLVSLLLDDNSCVQVFYPNTDEFELHETFPNHDACPYAPGHHVHLPSSFDSLPSTRVQWLTGQPNRQSIGVVESVQAMTVEVYWIAGIASTGARFVAGGAYTATNGGEGSALEKPSSTLPASEVKTVPLTEPYWRAADWGMMRSDLKCQAQQQYGDSDFWKPPESSFAGWCFSDVFDTACVVTITKTRLLVKPQNGLSTRTVMATDCLPVVEHSKRPLFPGQWVEEESSSLAGRHGVVQSVDASAQTAKVRWIDENDIVKSTETISLFDIALHGEFYVRPGDIAVDLTAESDEPPIGVVLSFRADNGCVIVRWSQSDNEGEHHPRDLGLIDGALAPPLEGEEGEGEEDDVGEGWETDEDMLDDGEDEDDGIEIASSEGGDDVDEMSGDPDHDDGDELMLNNSAPLIRLEEQQEDRGDDAESTRQEADDGNTEHQDSSFQLSNELPKDLPNPYGTEGSNQRRWSKAWRRDTRLLREGAPGVHSVVFEQRMDIVRAAVRGGKDTPYEHAYLFFTITLPNNYPDAPPSVAFDARSLNVNPNLYTDGKVCLSLLGTWTGDSSEEWQPFTSSIQQVLLSIQALVLNARPYQNEPGFASEESTRQAQTYNEQVYLNVLRLAMEQLRRPLGGCEELTKQVYRRERDAMLGKADRLLEEQEGSEGFTISLRNLLPRLRSALDAL